MRCHCCTFWRAGFMLERLYSRSSVLFGLEHVDRVRVWKSGTTVVLNEHHKNTRAPCNERSTLRQFLKRVQIIIRSRHLLPRSAATRAASLASCDRTSQSGDRNAAHRRSGSPASLPAPRWTTCILFLPLPAGCDSTAPAPWNIRHPHL